MYNTAKGLLQQNCEVHILAITTNKHPFVKNNYSSDLIEATNLKSVFINTDVKWYKALANVFSNNPFITERFKSEEFEVALIEQLQQNEYDIIQLESSFTCNYIDTIRKYSKARIILRAHNIEHQIIRQRANSEKGIKKLFLQAMAQKFKVFEKSIARKVDAICTITENDKNTFLKLASKKNIFTIPFGVNLSKFKVQKFKNFHLFHIGSMNWQPNKEGINWFVNKCWQKINGAHPSLRLYLAGRGMQKDFLESHYLNIDIVGEVESSKEFMSQYGIMVVPLLSGSGMRVKIIEAMAMGKAIISTTKGAEGINYTNNHNLIIANTPTDFFEAVSRLVYTPNLIETISKNARKLIETEYKNDLISKQLIEFYNKL